MKCETCNKLWTCECPIRVWGRAEKNRDKNLDVDIYTDFCSRYEKMNPISQINKKDKDTG